MPRRKKTSPFPGLMAISGALLLVIAIVIVVYQYSQPSAAPTASGPSPEIERISLVDAKAALDNRSAVFLDVRSAEVYAVNHIAGAISMPLEEIPARLAELDPNQWIITYCT